MLRKMSTRDGYALKTAVDAGLLICIISGGKNEGVRKRLEGLGVKEIYLGAHDKVVQLNNLFETHHLNPRNHIKASSNTHYKVYFFKEFFIFIQKVLFCGRTNCNKGRNLALWSKIDGFDPGDVKKEIERLKAVLQ